MRLNRTTIAAFAVAVAFAGCGGDDATSENANPDDAAVEGPSGQGQPAPDETSRGDE